MKPNQKLIRKQLDSALQEIKRLNSISIPGKGWIRAIRNALGMSGPQLAQRMQVSKQRVQRIEQDEVLGSTTLRTMRQAAEALNCVFVYSIVPQVSLEEIVKERARTIAVERLSRASQTMKLEGQELRNADMQDALENLIEELIAKEQSHLWDEKKMTFKCLYREL